MLLFFAMHLDKTPELNRGRLFLIDEVKELLDDGLPQAAQEIIRDPETGVSEEA